MNRVRTHLGLRRIHHHVLTMAGALELLTLKTQRGNQSSRNPSMTTRDIFPELPLDWTSIIPEALKASSKCTPQQVIAKLKAYAEVLEQQRDLDFWLTEAGQELLKEKIKETEKPPGEDSKSKWSTNTGITGSLCPLDYTAESKACLSPLGEAEEWIEIELTADSGACDTVIPKTMCPGIPIVPSQQSLFGLKYEVANGAALKNLGERRCQIWTEGATSAKNITMQVADVHKGLPSLSRCADMGFESRFGSEAGCLIHVETGEVIPLVRRGNLAAMLG